ncbi:Three-deoxy-D-manno-octulosonic-acid transferase domain-containing protein [Thermodesulfatator indicus DSM 15286]|uniref:3-deoxy-D-manno-octulosonic acid transferase n=1 Tax=Thermodesulfatator indicus (strain DSM 15286 / JCM 11887 / CIR29812) TaxID=667014 RepID=F8A8G2_THEID|nr:glycosyltransferase N-terminal domain-containing protein [Thermodesulfatator indicus]AEH43968.1 Three-deoxy-D-manno-octulosonic-acid transferase domain-containing protein [Thermodesulfatator indicus DSM 15286]
MLKAYRLIGQLLTPFFLAKGIPKERKGELPKADIWIHAASVGEANVAASIISNFLRYHPEVKILLTLHTSTGIKKAKDLLEDFPVFISWAPFDTPSFVKKALLSVSPKVFAIVETELWPNLICEAHASGTKLLILNGRLSSRSFKKYKLIRPLLKELFFKFEHIAVIGPEEKERYLALGAPPEKVSIEGNAKYDLLWERHKKLDLKKIVSRLPQKPLFVFGSIRKGEEKIIGEVLSLLQKTLPKVHFILVPRHLTFIPGIKNELSQRGLSFRLYSKPVNDSLVTIVDEIGPLFGIYALSKAAFVGGSLCPKGGQNPFEPAVFKKPVLFGPYMENFSYEAKALVTAGGAQIVKTPDELAQAIKGFFTDEKLTQKTGEAAFESFKKFLGATTRYVSLLEEIFIK